MDDTTGRVARSRKSDSKLPQDTERRAREIRAEIADTRSDMSDTINALQERLSPAHLAEQARESVRNAATEKVKHMANTAGDAMEQVFGTSLVETVRANPIPAAMIGIGAAWLLTRRRSAGRATHTDDGGSHAGAYRAGYAGEYDPAHRGPGDGAVGTRGTLGRESAGSIAGQARQTLGDLSDRAQSAASDVSEATRRTARRAQLQVRDVLRNNPLALGAAAMVVGAVVGMSVPESDVENSLMGEARDSVVDRARALATTAADRVSAAASDLVDSASQTGEQAKDATSSSGGQSSKTGSESRASGTTPTP